MFLSMTALTSEKPSVTSHPCRFRPHASLYAGGRSLLPDSYSARVASADSGDALGDTEVSAILLDAGGVLVFPRPGLVWPSLRAAGLQPDPATLERAHYHAMLAQDVETQPPAPGTWWRNYLLTYVAACGAPDGRAERLATEIAERPRTGSWAYAGLGVKEGLRA